jgi:23S rRNA pseudouridine1911/1915/1917 synthase
MLVPVEADAAAGLARSAGSARLDRPDRRDWSGPIDGGAAAATRGARCATVWELRGSLLLDLTRGYRDGEWLRIPLPDPRPEGLADGTHPHDVRRRLIAEGLLPGKWLNRLFSVGGIRLENGLLSLRAFPPCGRTDRPPLPDGGEPAEAEALYEDDWCLVLLKPAGMPVHPAHPGMGGTLDEAAFRHVLRAGDPLPVRHIHRLDADTSGPVLYAKNDLAQLRLDEAMREKRIGRRYVVIVHGAPKPRTGTIDAPIGRDRHHGSRRRVTPGGDRAVTHYETVKTAGGMSLVRVRLETGRTHQIRVHFSHIGHPLLGDALYGAPADPLPHQALHGESLVFPHPWTGRTIAVEAPRPRWFEDALRRFGLM